MRKLDNDVGQLQADTGDGDDTDDDTDNRTGDRNAQALLGAGLQRIDQLVLEDIL